MVVRVEVRARRGRKNPLVFVAKKLEGTSVREAAVYREWLARHPIPLAPRFLGTLPSEGGAVLLFMQALPPRAGWPWGDQAKTRGVLAQLARLHMSAVRPYPRAISDWDFEASLAGSSQKALDLLEEIPRRYLPHDLLRTRAAARRVVLCLGMLRRELLSSPRFGTTVLHGDVHSGNVALVPRPEGESPLFCDWARARVGSPLEDVSSWLKSLGLWEPEAARRHDTLLQAYLDERGMNRAMDSELRASYWFAAACNGLAGALLYYLHSAAEDLRNGRPADFRLARGWARVIRRAGAFVS